MIFMKVPAERAEAFERAWHEITPQVSNWPGIIRQALLRDISDPSTFIVTSDWETREAFHQFERSPEQDVLTAPLRQLRESAHLTLYDLIAHAD